MGTGGVSRSDSLLKCVQYSADQLHKLGKRWNDRLSFERCSIAEEYRKGRLAITIDLNIPSLHRRRYYIQFSAIRDAKGTSPETKPAISHNDVGGYVLQFENMEGRNQQNVLIRDIQIVKCAQERVASLVSANVVCQHGDDIRRTLQYSLTQGRYEFIFVVKHPKCSPFGGLASGGGDKLDIGNIQRSSQIMDGVSEDKGDITWDIPDHLHLQEIVSGLSVFLYSNSAEITMNKVADHLCELRNVLIGPFDL